MSAREGKHLLIHDAAHVRAAIVPFAYTDFGSTVAKEQARTLAGVQNWAGEERFVVR